MTGTVDSAVVYRKWFILPREVSFAVGEPTRYAVKHIIASEKSAEGIVGGITAEGRNSMER